MASFNRELEEAAKDLGAGRWVRDSNGGAPERKDFFSDEPEPDPLIPDPDPTVSRGRARRGVGGAPRPENIDVSAVSRQVPKMLAAAAVSSLL